MKKINQNLFLKNKSNLLYTFYSLLNFLFVYFIIDYNQNNLHIFFDQEKFFITIIINTILIGLLFFNLFLFSYEFIFYNPNKKQKIFIAIFNITNLILIIYIILYIFLLLKLSIMSEIDVEKAIRIVYQINERIKYLMMSIITIIPFYIYYKNKFENLNNKEEDE